VTMQLDAGLAVRLRNAAAALGTSAAAEFGAAVEAHVSRLEGEHNQGQPFPERPAKPHGPTAPDVRSRQVPPSDVAPFIKLREENAGDEENLQ
jgi:hypothetical protein